MDEVRQLQTELKGYPERIFEAELAAENLREIWMAAKVRRDYSSTREYLKRKAEGATDNQAKAHAAEATFDLDQQLIVAESKYRKAEANRMYLENKFAAIRKSANLEEARIQKLGML